MNIAMICSSAEPGRDGVGDYSVRLGVSLVAMGHRVLIIAERDFAVSGDEPVHGEREGLPVVRLPGNAPNELRGRALAGALGRFAPDWVMVEFVCWGFAQDGILDPPLHSLIAALSGRRVAIYCHELWLGLEQGASLRHRLWGWRQRRGILRFLSQLKPSLVMTSNAVYHSVLERLGWRPRMIPLFSNIPFHAEGRDEFLSLLAQRAGEPLWSTRRDVMIVAVFGNVDPQWQPQEALRWLGTEAGRCNRKLVLVIAGRRSPKAEKNVQRIAQDVSAFAKAVTLGEVSPAAVSGLLQEADVGLPVCDWLRLGKSGVAAAMTAHGLPILIARNGESYRGLPDFAVTHSPLVFRFDVHHPPDFERLAGARTPPVDSLSQITQQFVSALTAVIPGS